MNVVSQFYGFEHLEIMNSDEEFEGNNDNTCTSTQSSIDAETIKRTVSQLKMSVREIAQAMSNQKRGITGEERILRELHDMKNLLCELNRNMSVLVSGQPDACGGSAPITENTLPEGQSENAPPNEEAMNIVDVTDANPTEVPALEHIQTTVKTLISKRDELSTENVNEMLVSVLCDVDKILSSLGMDGTNKDPGCEMPKSQNPTETPTRLRSTSQVNKALSCLQKQIRCLKPDANLQEGDIETMIHSITSEIKDIIVTKSPDPNKLTKLEKSLKCLAGDLTNQGAGNSAQANEIREVLGMMRPNPVVNTNPNNLNDGEQCYAELVETPTINQAMSQLLKIIQGLDSKASLPNCGLESDITCLMEMLLEIIASGCGGNDTVFDQIETLLKSFEDEVCRQCPSESTVLAKIREVQGRLMDGNAATSPTDRCGSNVYEGCFKVSNAQCAAATLQETPELCKIVNVLQSFVKCMKPDAQFNSCDMQSNILCLLETIKGLIQSNCMEGKAMEKIKSILKCLECELTKQCQAATQILAKLREVLQVIDSRKDNMCAQIGTAQQGSSLQPTQLLTCLIKHLQKLVQSARPDVQCPEGDLEASFSCLLDSLKEILQSGALNPSMLEKLQKMMRCLECDLAKQGPAGAALLAKVRDIRRQLNDGACAQNAPDQSAATLQETPELRKIATALQNFVKCLKPDIQFSSCELQPLLETILDTLKMLIQCGSLDPKVLEKTKSILKCLEAELCKQGQAAASLLAKLHEVLQVIDGGSASSSLQPTQLLTCIFKHLQKLIQIVKPDIQCPEGDLEAGLNCLLDNLKELNQYGCLNSSVTEKLPKMLRCLECDLVKQGPAGAALLAKVRDIRQQLNDGTGTGCEVEQTATDPCAMTATLKDTPELRKILTILQNFIKCLRPEMQFNGCDVQSLLDCVLETIQLLVQCNSLDLKSMEKLRSLLKCLEGELCKQGQAAAPFLAKIQEIMQMSSRNDACGAEQSQPDPCAASATLQETPELSKVVTALQNFVKCMKPDTQINTCDLQSNILCLLETLKMIIQSSCHDPRALEKLKCMIMCLETELCKQGQVASTLLAKVREVAQVIDNCGGSNQSDPCQMTSNPCATSLKMTPELQNIVAQLQNLIKCLKPDAQFNSCDLQQNLQCMLEILKMIIQSGCANPSILEKVKNLLTCLERELCKQGQAAAQLLAKVREVQQMIPANGACGMSEQGTGGLRETQKLRCSVAELQKLIQCLRPDIRFKSCDSASAILCAMKIFKETLPNRPTDCTFLSQLSMILESVEVELNEQGMVQSNLMVSVCEVKQLIGRLSMSGGATTTDACGQGGQNESFEAIVGRTLEKMDGYIRELECVLRDFVGPLNSGCGATQEKNDTCFNNNDLIQANDIEEMLCEEGDDDSFLI